jgi:polyferredoxin
LIYARSILAVVYLALAVVAFAAPWMPRVFWTMVMPVVPMAVVLIGFHAARRLCPIATLAGLGARAGRHARVPRFLARTPLAVPLAILLVALIVRLVATNGDGVALGVMLLAIVAAAAAANALFGGKAWCNYLCPVGVVERIYTDAGGLRRSRTDSSCSPCTGCKRSCPDIDQERSYQASLSSVDRRIAFYAFPGLVLGFYSYYRLREGEWAAFFDGRWTAHRADAELLLGPGFEMWPGGAAPGGGPPRRGVLEGAGVWR